MKLTYFVGKEPNFGDELNASMWQQLLPEGFLDGDDNELFLGIGSILWDHLPADKMKHVMGSGYGSYTSPPQATGPDWNVVWVRGPRTAQAIGVDPSVAITDSAVLIRVTDLPPPATGIDVAFMPHFESLIRGNWKKVCKLAGITYLDPREDHQSLLAKLRGARLVITEAMHGAIVSDALRTPWIAIKPFAHLHRAKWSDWSESLSLDLRWNDLRASTVFEAYTRHSGSQGKGGKSHKLFTGTHMVPVDTAMAHLAARSLQKLAERTEPQLSTDAEIERATARCQEALDGFVKTRA